MAHQIELNEMTIEEKLQMMEVLWNDLARNAADLDSPAWHGQVLAERETALEQGDDHIEDWSLARSNA